MSRKLCRLCPVKYAGPLGVDDCCVFARSRLCRVLCVFMGYVYLDKEMRHGIICKTWFFISAYGLDHDLETESAASSPSRAGVAKPDGRSSKGRSLPRQRLLRAGGYRSSAIRDAPKRARERADSEFSGDPLRRFSCHVLPSANGLRAGRCGGINAAEERATGRSQTDGRGLGFSLSETAKRNRTQLIGLGRLGQRAVRSVSTSTFDRASSRATEKKRTRPSIAKTLCQQDKEHLVSSYERLREQTTKSPSTELTTGQHLFCQRGFAAWLADFCCDTGATPPAPMSRSVSVLDGPEAILPDEASNTFACLVASMVQPFLSTGATS